MQLFSRLGPMRVAALAAVAVGLGAFFLLFTDRMTRQDMGVLYADLATSDAAGIVSRLEDLGVPFEVSEAGDTVMVPRKDAARLRMTMAEAGLPSGGATGYEIFDNENGFSATSFSQQINRLRALEGELGRSIRTMAQIQAVRVHLVLPQREPFSHEEQQPTASIVLALQGGVTLSPQQVSAIQHLVASAVPKLSASKVSVVDTEGNLLARPYDENEAGEAGEIASTIQLRQAHEERVARAVERLLERTLGYGKVRAEVAAEMDFDRITTSTETFDPEGQVLRSTQTITENNTSTESGSGTVSVDNNIPNAGEQDDASRGTEQSRLEETANYEISKTMRTHIREAGAIRRMSVAVMVDGVHGVNADGQRTYTERSPDELEKIATLVRSAVGFDEARGDRVNVVNMRFARPLDLPLDETEEAMLGGLDKADYFRMAEMAVLSIVALLALLMVVRPAVARFVEASRRPVEDGHAMVEGAPAAPALAAPAGGQAADPGYAAALEGLDPDAINVDRIEGRIRESSVKRISEIIQRHPEEAVGIVRNWMYQQS